MRYFIISLCAFILASCSRTKEGTTIVEGVVKDEKSGAVLPNFKIAIYKEVSDFGALDNGKNHAMQTLTTDENGYFSASFEADKRHIYYVGMAMPPHEKYCSVSGAIKSAEKNQLEVKAKRNSTLRLRIINEAPVDTATSFYVSLIGGSRQNYFLTDTTAFVNVCAETGKVHWRIVSSNNIYEGEKQFNVAGWDTAAVEIRY